MTLATHIIAGTVLSYAYAESPTEAFVIGLTTHYLLDTISHWDYPIHSLIIDSKTSTRAKKIAILLLDMAKVTIDVLLGVLVIWLLLSTRAILDPKIIAAILGAALPDFLQFLYIISGNKILGKLQRFHHAFHSSSSLNNSPVKGITFQIIFILLLVLTVI